MEESIAQTQLKSQQRRTESRRSWDAFRERLIKQPSLLVSPTHLGQGSGISDLVNLTIWLTRSTGIAEYHRAALHWERLATAFSPDVAAAYREAMILLWRNVTPEKPVYGERGLITTKYANILAIAGITLQASLSAEWAQELTSDDATLAAQHACSEQVAGYQPWLDHLISERPREALPVIHAALRDEWLSLSDRSTFLLHNFAYGSQMIPQPLRERLFEVIVSNDAPNLRHAELGVGILKRIAREDPARSHLTSIALERLQWSCIDDGRRSMIWISVLFITSPADAVAALENWIESTPSARQETRAQTAFSILFGHERHPVSSALAELPTSALEQLVNYAFKFIAPNDDAVRDGAYTPDIRDDAESARGLLMNILLARSGPDAFNAVRRLEEAGIAGIPRKRFLELSRRKAEQDSEFTAWQPEQVVVLERSHAAPIRTSEDLMAVVLRVLEEIRRDIIHSDASSRSLLKKASVERDVQTWLAEQLSLRSRGRYQVLREPEVADKKEPDIVVAGVDNPLQLAIEVKLAEKNWTVTDLEAALTQRLATDYLRPTARRCGVLFISHHRSKTWRAPEDQRPLTFSAVISRLGTLAESLKSNEAGPIRVSVFGLDVSGPP